MLFQFANVDLNKTYTTKLPCEKHSLSTDKKYLFNILSDRVNAKLSDKKSLQKHSTLFFVYRTCHIDTKVNTYMWQIV